MAVRVTGPPSHMPKLPRPSSRGAMKPMFMKSTTQAARGGLTLACRAFYQKCNIVTLWMASMPAARPFNSLLLPMAAAQQVLMRHRGHQVDKHIIDGGYHGAGDWVSLRRIFI